MEQSRHWLAIGGSVLLILGAGCATSQNERRMLLERTSAEVAYDLPPKQVMDAARVVLSEHGYLLLASSGEAHSLRTQWKVDGNLDSTARWSKVLVIGQHRSDGRFVLRAQQVVWATGGRTAPHPGMASGGGKNGSDGATNYVPGEPYSPAKPVFSRALDLEWEILQRLDPQFAAEVEQQVDIYLAHTQR